MNGVSEGKKKKEGLLVLIFKEEYPSKIKKKRFKKVFKRKPMLFKLEPSCNLVKASFCTFVIINCIPVYVNIRHSYFAVQNKKNYL